MAAILEAASQLFDRGSATTTSIARRAGVSIGSLYEYFRDKDAIIDSLIDRHVGESERALLAALDATDPAVESLAEVVQRLVRAMIDLHGDHPGLHRRLVAWGSTQPRVRRRVDAAEERVRERLAARLQQHPDVEVADVALAARVVARGTNALVHRHVEAPADVSDDAFVAELTRLWVGYLRGG